MTGQSPTSEASRDSDTTLLSQYCAGSEDAASRLFARYEGKLHRLADRRLGKDLRQRVDADDIVQSVFRTFFRRAVKGDYELPDGEELWNLLVVIGLNKVRGQAIRHRAQRRDVSRSTSSSGTDAQEISMDESGLMVLRIAIDELLEKLPQSHGQIVNLRIEGREVSDIAKLTERSRRTVERVLQQFREHLTQLILPEHDNQ